MGTPYVPQLAPKQGFRSCGPAVDRKVTSERKNVKIGPLAGYAVVLLTLCWSLPMDRISGVEASERLSPSPRRRPVALPKFCAFDRSLTLLQEIDCASPPASADFADFPKGVSEVKPILGRPARALPAGDTWSYMTFTLGKDLKSGPLQAGAAYMLTVEYPEDISRSMFVLNRGCETQRGFYTGRALGDQLGGYVNPNPESLRIPLTGEYEQWTQYFHLHHRYPDLYQPRDDGFRTQTPADGFRVIIVHLDRRQAPVSAGAACRKIRLYKVTEPVALKYRELPEDLPKRHVFWREEMSDNVVNYADSPAQWGVPDDKLWYRYKMELMRFLGTKTFSKDLLEFGHCQGWDVRDTQWFIPARDHLKDRWAEIIDLCAEYDFDVIPYYEYYGSTGPKGLGRQQRCISLKGEQTYTNISWVEKFNADVTDPDTLVDARRLLRETMVRYKDKVEFVAAWFRARPSALPVSFADAAIRRFENDTQRDSTSVSREKLKADEILFKEYRRWWFGKRRAFLNGLAEYLDRELDRKTDILFTWDPTEPGWRLPGPKKYIVNDDSETWAQIRKTLQEQGIWWASTDLKQCLARNDYLHAMQTPRGDYGSAEWSNSSPEADPHNYQQESDVILTHPIHKVFSITAESLAAFRTEEDLAVIRHYCLNENAPDHRNPKENPLGYFVADVERTGPYSMIVEARAVALGNPNYLGYLASNNWNHGFPQYARRFFANFLSLPALRGAVVADAADKSDVVVRRIPTQNHGTWYALVNLNYTAERVSVRIEDKGVVVHAPTGTKLGPAPGLLEFELHPFELVSLRVY